MLQQDRQRRLGLGNGTRKGAWEANGRTGRGVRVGVIGCGYWGPALVRNLHSLPEVDLLAVADQRPERLREVAHLHPTAELVTSHKHLLVEDIDAVVIATPIHTHFELAREALLARKHVLVEKPLATSVAEADELVRLARRFRRVLMVGHTFLYNPAVQELRRLVQEGELGRIYHGESARLNLGLFQDRTNVIWDLAPHDLSILMHVLGQDPVSVSARGSQCIRPDVHDVCHLDVQFANGTDVHVHLSWLDPDKVRRMTLVGERRMAVYDDLSPAEKVRLYDSGVEVAEGRVGYRQGHIFIPRIEWREPLRAECQHFLDCVTTGRRPLSDGEHGRTVVAALEAATISLAENGTPVPVTS